MIDLMIQPLLPVVSGLTVFSGGGLRLAGLAVPARIPNGKDKGLLVPVAQDVTGVRAWETGRYDELLPNEYYRGVWFFEQVSDTEFLGYGDGHERNIMYYESDVVLKGWLNVKKLQYPEYASARMLLELTQGLTAGTSPVARDAGRLNVTTNSSTGALVDVQVLRQLRHGPDVFSSYTELVPEVLPEFEYFGLLLRLRLAIGIECYTELEA